MNLSAGTVALKTALDNYRTAWKAFLVIHHIEALENQAVATTLSWKVADKADLFANLAAVASQTEQVHIGTVNNRFIASVLLKAPITDNLWLIKILERRPGSADPLGLDSLDYKVADSQQTFSVLQAAQTGVLREHNDMHEWLSLRFGKAREFEAKFTDHLVLHVGIKELKLAEEQLISHLGLDSKDK